jgi:predicted Zn-dependent protease
MILIIVSIVIYAQAQFRIPNIPISPRIPDFGRNNNNGGNQPSQLDLLQSGRNFLDVLDLDNPQRQQELGQSIAIAISNKYPVGKDRALNEYVNLVGLTIASVSPKPDLNFAFGVLDTPDVGAYSTPGGYVFVTRGALQLMSDESELAGVLAHEVAHVVLNHGVEAVKHAKLAQAASPFTKQYGQKFGAFSQYVDQGVNFVLVNGYSQEQEKQADSKAVEFLILANYDPRGFVHFLNRLDAQNQHLPSPLMRTHPLTKDRIGDVTRQIASYRSVAGVTLKERFAANMATLGKPTTVPTTPAPPVAPPPHPTPPPPQPQPNRQPSFIPGFLRNN